MKTDIYWNLHKNLFSVKDRKTGRVIDHVEECWIVEPKYVVQPAGRRRVIKEGRKNVHAFVRGVWQSRQKSDDLYFKRKVTYNPYKYKSFVYAGCAGEEVNEKNSFLCHLYIDKTDNKPVIESWEL